MATSKVSAEERLLRKRQAARIRQQRCRARKRQAMLERHGKDTEVTQQPGHVTVTASENQHPNHASHRTPPPQFVRPQSPRSVYWKEAWAHAEADRRLIERRLAKRQPAWAAPHMVEARYDTSTVEYHPVYSRRYQATPPLAPPPRTVPRLVPAIRHPHARYYVERGAPPRFAVERELPEYYRRPETEYRQPPKSWMRKVQVQAPPQPPKPVLSVKRADPIKPVVPVKRADPIKSKEEAAIDAILSLKSEVVSPPTIKRVVQDDKSAFQRLNHLREMRAGLYTMMRK